MDPNTITAAQEKTDWLKNRMEIEREWETALHDEDSEIVPSKLPISVPPVRRAA